MQTLSSNTRARLEMRRRARLFAVFVLLVFFVLTGEVLLYVEPVPYQPDCEREPAPPRPLVVVAIV